MDTEIKIEEKISLLQLELSQMSDEIYNQQKEITELKLQFKKLKYKTFVPLRKNERTKERTRTDLEVVYVQYINVNIKYMHHYSI